MNIIHVKGAGSTASTTQFISRFLSSDSSRAEAKREARTGIRNLTCTKFDLLGFLVDMKVHIQNVPTESGGIE
jgi:hypothetical protein